MRYEVPSDNYYHQDQRDRAVALGCAGVIAIGLLIVGVLVCAVAWSLAP